MVRARRTPHAIVQEPTGLGLGDDGRPSARDATAAQDTTATDAERERLAQDLHDGVQQQLAALQIRLGLAADRFAERGDTEAGTVLREFGDDVDQVIDDLRDRIAGVGGTLAVDSAPERGTRVHGSVPKPGWR